MSKIDASTFEEWTIAGLQQAMAKGELTSVEITLLYLERIALYDKHGSAVNSVLEVNPDALQIAEAMDRERAATGARGPLHGIPVLLKDNIDTADKMHTSAGSIALANSYAKRDSHVAAQLRNAGAVLLGKVNMTEWANFMTQKMPNGYSSRGGQVKNPYGPGKFDTGGSSAGSGASIAANLAAFAIGTETDGSILSPSTQNSLVGLKPTVGLIGRTGIVPIAHSQDTAGPMARTVADVAMALGALTAIDEADVATWSTVGKALPDYTAHLESKGLSGARIGIIRTHFYTALSDEKQALFDAAVGVLKSEGAVLIDNLELAHTKQLENFDVLVYEFKTDLNAYLSQLDANVPVHSLEDVIAFNKEHQEEALKYGQIWMDAAQATSGTLTEREYLRNRAEDLRTTREEGIDALLTVNRLDALLFVGSEGSSLGAKSGYPSLTVPAGYLPSGEPLGITFTGTAYSEPTLIRLGYAYEQATRHRVAPKLHSEDSDCGEDQPEAKNASQVTLEGEQ